MATGIEAWSRNEPGDHHRRAGRSGLDAEPDERLPRRCHVGLDGQRRPVIGDSLFTQALAAIDGAAVAIGAGIAGFERDRLGEVGDGLVVAALPGVGGAAIVVGLGVVRFEGDRLGIVGDDLVVEPSAAMVGAAIGVGLGVVGFGGDRLGVVGDGLVAQVLGDIGGAATVVVFGQTRRRYLALLNSRGATGDPLIGRGMGAGAPIALLLGLGPRRRGDEGQCHGDQSLPHAASPAAFAARSVISVERCGGSRALSKPRIAIPQSRLGPDFGPPRRDEFRRDDLQTIKDGGDVHGLPLEPRRLRIERRPHLHWGFGQQP